jgi:hypothetical protein
MSSDRFHGAIEGPLGGMAFKGGTSLTFSLHHDRVPLLLEIAAEAKEGTPWLTIRAAEWEPGAAKRLIFDGSLAALTEWPLGSAPVELLVPSPSTQPPPVHILLRSSSVLCGAQDDTASNDLGNVTCDACLPIYDEVGGCGDPSCPGWCIMNAQAPALSWPGPTCRTRRGSASSFPATATLLREAPGRPSWWLHPESRPAGSASSLPATPALLAKRRGAAELVSWDRASETPLSRAAMSLGAVSKLALLGAG